MNSSIDLQSAELVDFSDIDYCPDELLPSRGAYGHSAAPLSRMAASLAAGVVFICGSLAAWRGKARSSGVTTREVFAGASSTR
jgi:hypothetical protein